MPSPSLSLQQDVLLPPGELQQRPTQLNKLNDFFLIRNRKNPLAQSCISCTPVSLASAHVGREGTLETGLGLCVSHCHTWQSLVSSCNAPLKGAEVLLYGSTAVRL